MVAVNIQTFGGMIPALDDRLLPPESASLSENAWLYSGKLVGFPAPEKLYESVNTLGKVYRIPASYSNAPYPYGSTWLEFENADTDVIRSPVHDDTFDRYYWVSSTTPPQYNTLDRIKNGDPPFLLGIPVPSGVSVDPSGGSSDIVVSRAYVVTWVSAYGEEGAPSEPAVATGKQDDTWTVTIPQPNANDLGINRNLTHVRIYRTVTSSGGVATYFQVAELPITTTDYNDTLTDEQVSANSQLQSLEWTSPPSDLQGFTMMPNGIVASWRKNELWFSEPYRPHAWPASYVLTTEYPIVGLGIAGQTLVVCTQGNPETASGVNPAYITTSRLTTLEPCVSRSSIISAPEGVYYASTNGLVLVVPGRAENITRNLITKDRWQQFTKGTKLRAARLGTGYYAFGSVMPGVFSYAFETTAFAQEDYSGAHLGVFIDPMNERVAMNILTSAEAVANIQNDAWSGDVYIIRDKCVYRIDQSNPEPTIETAKWRSRIFQTSDKRNLGAMRVYFEVPPNTPPNEYGVVRVWADGRLILERELQVSGELWRLPSGFKADFWQFEVETKVKIISVQMASTAKELQSV